MGNTANPSFHDVEVDSRYVEYQKDGVFNEHLLYLLVSTHAVIGHTGEYGPLKFKVDSVAKLFCHLSPAVLNFYSK